MDENIIIHINCPQYLIRFLEKSCGDQPIRFIPMSDPNRMLGMFLAIAPLGYQQKDHGDNTLKVVLPQFRHKDIRIYNYMSARKQTHFVKYIHNWFKVIFHNEMNKYIAMGFRRKDSIYLFMDSWDMPESSFDALLKDYNRYMVTRSKHGEINRRIIPNYPKLLPDSEPGEITEIPERMESNSIAMP